MRLGKSGGRGATQLTAHVTEVTRQQRHTGAGACRLPQGGKRIDPKNDLSISNIFAHPAADYRGGQRIIEPDPLVTRGVVAAALARQVGGRSIDGEARLSARGGSPLVTLSLFRSRGFATGLAMALAFYMLSSFYLTFAVYLQNGLHRSPLEAGIATLPFAVGYFISSLVSSAIMLRLGVRALTLGFVLQILGFGAVMVAVSQVLAEAFELGLVVAGVGFGIVMPSVIKAVLGGIDQRHAGLASGVVISTFQIGAALGVAVIGGVFYYALGTEETISAYAHAFTLALGCNVALLALGALLSLWLAHQSAGARV